MNDERTEGVVIVEPIVFDNGKKRVLPGAKKTLACTLDEHGNIKHGFTRDEVEYYSNLFHITMDENYWANFRVVLSDSTRTFDLANPRARMQVKFLRQHPMVADVGKPLTDRTIYKIVDEEFEAELEAKRLDYKKLAYKCLEDMDLDDAKRFLRLYGLKGDKQSRALVFKRLDEKLVDDPKKFVELYEDKNKELKILLLELDAFEVVRKNKTHYYWGDIHLGENEEIAITFLKDKDNQTELIAMKKELEEKKKLV